MAENLHFEIDESQSIEESISRLLSKKFTVVRKGYSVEEVREFIFDVEIHFRKMLRREAELYIKLTDAIKRLEAPELDEETLSRAIGMESGKVLRAAHEAAKDILTQAQLRAEELLAEASAVMEKSSIRAEESANRIIDEAKVAAEVELEGAKERCIEMLAEAKASRRKILNDLMERRSSLSHQVRQLQAAVDTFRMIFNNAEKAVREVNITLMDAEQSAKRAGDLAVAEDAFGENNLDSVELPSVDPEQSSPFGEYGDSGDSAEPENDNSYYAIEGYQGVIPADQDKNVSEVSDNNPKGLVQYSELSEDPIKGSKVDIAAVNIADSDIPVPRDQNVTMTTVEEKSCISDEYSKENGIDKPEPSFGNLLPNEGDLLDSEDANVLSNRWNDMESESGFRILGSAPISISPKHTVYGESKDSAPDTLQHLDQGILGPITAGVQAQEPISTSEPGAVFIQSQNARSTDDKNDSTSHKDYNTVFDSGKSSPEINDHGLATVESESGEDVATSDLFRFPKGDIDTIFAQIRAGRDKEVRQAISVLDGELTYPANTDTNNSSGTKVWGDGDDSVNIGVDVIPLSSHLDDTGFVDVEVGKQDTYVEITEVDGQQDTYGEDLRSFLAASEEYLLRKTKKLIRQHQNLVLDDLRLNWNKESYDYDKTNYLESCEQDIEDMVSNLKKLYADMRAFVTTQSFDAHVEIFLDASVDFVRETHSLISHVLEPVAKILREALSKKVNSLQDEQDFMEHLSSVYRELKGDRLERSVGDCVVRVSSGGIYDEALKRGSHLKWIMDAEVCPDCEDNSLLVVFAGSPFPTGHLMPPAHPGCRCEIRVLEENLN